MTAVTVLARGSSDANRPHRPRAACTLARVKNLTAGELLAFLQEHIAKNPAAADLPAVTIEGGHLTNIRDVNVSKLHGGMMLLQGRDYDLPEFDGKLLVPLLDDPS